MNRRFTIIGFTEAELGFVLAAAFAAIGVSYSTNAAAVARKRTSADSAYVAERAAHDSVARAMQALRDSLRKKSNLTPLCSERGESWQPVADLTVTGGNSYRTQGQTIGFDELRSLLAAPIATSARLRCKFRVIVHATPGVDAPEHSLAVARLKTLFYVDERQR